MQTTKEETLLDAGQIVKYPNEQEVLLCLQRSHFCTCKEVSPIGGLFLAWPYLPHVIATTRSTSKTRKKENPTVAQKQRIGLFEDHHAVNSSLGVKSQGFKSFGSGSARRCVGQPLRRRSWRELSTQNGPQLRRGKMWILPMGDALAFLTASDRFQMVSFEVSKSGQLQGSILKATPFMLTAGIWPLNCSGPMALAPSGRLASDH